LADPIVPVCGYEYYMYIPNQNDNTSSNDNNTKINHIDNTISKNGNNSNTANMLTLSESTATTKTATTATATT